MSSSHFPDKPQPLLTEPQQENMHPLQRRQAVFFHRSEISEKILPTYIWSPSPSSIISSSEAIHKISNLSATWKSFNYFQAGTKYAWITSTHRQHHGCLQEVLKLPQMNHFYPLGHLSLHNFPWMIFHISRASQVVLMVKNLPANAEDTRNMGSIPGSGRSPRVGNGTSLQYCCLGNSMDKRVWKATVHGITKSQTQHVPRMHALILVKHAACSALRKVLYGDY